MKYRVKLDIVVEADDASDALEAAIVGIQEVQDTAALHGVDWGYSAMWPEGPVSCTVLKTGD